MTNKSSVISSSRSFAMVYSKLENGGRTQYPLFHRSMSRWKSRDATFQCRQALNASIPWNPYVLHVGKRLDEGYHACKTMDQGQRKYPDDAESHLLTQARFQILFALQKACLGMELGKYLQKIPMIKAIKSVQSYEHQKISKCEIQVRTAQNLARSIAGSALLRLLSGVMSLLVGGQNVFCISCKRSRRLSSSLSYVHLINHCRVKHILRIT